MDKQINRSIIANQNDPKGGVPANRRNDLKNIASERMAQIDPSVNRMDYEQTSRRRVLRLGKDRRLVFQKISPKQWIVKQFHRGRESYPYPFNIENPLVDISKSIQKKEKADNEMRKWIKRIKSYLKVLSKSKHLDDNMVKIFEHERVKYENGEFPKLKTLALNIYPTLSDIDHVQEKACERGINMTPDEVTKVGLTIDAYDHTIQEFIKRLFS